MAAIIAGTTINSTTNTVGPFTSASFTPAVDDLLVAIVSWDGTTGTLTVTDSEGGSWTQVATTPKSAGADTMYLVLRNSGVSGAAMTVTIENSIAGTGVLASILRASGMSRYGAAAKRQSAIEEGGAAETPNITFEALAAVLTENPTIIGCGNSVNPATLSPNASWTERNDIGHATPAKGLETKSRDSGFTGTNVQYAAATSTVWGCVAVELDTSVVGGGSGMGDIASIAGIVDIVVEND